MFRVRAQPLGHVGQQLQALLVAHAAGVQMRSPQCRRTPTGGAGCSAPVAAGSRPCRPSSGTGIDAPRRHRARAAAPAYRRQMVETRSKRRTSQPYVRCSRRGKLRALISPRPQAASASRSWTCRHARPPHSRAASSAVGAANAVGSTAQIRSGRKRAACHRHGTRLLMANDNRCKIRVQRRQRARQPNGAAQHPHTAHGLAPPCPGSVSGADPPFRVVGRRRDHAHLVAAFAQPRDEISGIPPHARELRRKVETEDEDLHRAQPERELKQDNLSHG